jgi:hypothetical protein
VSENIGGGERKAFLVGLLARRNYEQSGIQEACYTA